MCQEYSVVAWILGSHLHVRCEQGLEDSLPTWRQVGTSCWYLASVPLHVGFPGGASGEEPPASEGDVSDTGSIPGSERSPGGGQGNPLQYSCLENPMDRGAWWAAVHGVAKC